MNEPSSPTKHRVVIIDDDGGPTELYVRALEMDGFQVQHLKGVRATVDWLAASPTAPDVIILDLMMPPENCLAPADCQDGLTSGILILRRLRQQFGQIRILILSNATDPKILKELPEDEDQAWFRRKSKLDLPPFDLAEEIGLWLKKPQPKAPKGR